MLVTPYYNKPPSQALSAFAAVAEKTELPLLVQRSGQNGMQSTARHPCCCGRLPQHCGGKEASGILDQVAEIRTKCGPEFVISGDDNLTLPIMAVGGDGIVSVASHVAGEHIQGMIRAFLAGDVARAAEVHRRLLPLFKGIFITANPIPIKVALALAGFDVGGLRPPMIEATDAERAHIEGIMQSLDLI